MARSRAPIKPKISRSLFLSLVLHTFCFVVLFVTVSNKAADPIMVNLLKNPEDGKVIQAGLVNQKEIDRAIQRQVAAERLKEQQLENQRKAEQAKIEEQRKAEQAKAEAEQAKLEAIAAKKALEIESLRKTKEIAAKAAADKKANIEKQKNAKEQAQKKLAEMETAQRNKSKLDLDKRLNAKKQADALKAERDRQVAEHNSLLIQEVDRYKAMFQAAIEENRTVSGVFAGNPICKIRVRLMPDGSIISANVIQPSGNPAYDSMSQAAIHKAAPFPMPADTELCEKLREIVLTFKNGEQTSDA